jgi:hypothetical protein
MLRPGIRRFASRDDGFGAQRAFPAVDRELVRPRAIDS